MTVAAVWRVSQPFPSSTTPPIFPLRIRVRNLRFGGAVSVPITVSAVSEKPVTACAFVAGPGPAAAETTETAATATRPASSLSMADRVALVSAPSGAANCRAAGRD